MEKNPAVLLVHDGELAELGPLIAGLGVDLHERVGAPTEAERARSWDLALGSPWRLMELDRGPGYPAERIAAFGGDSRTARSMLARSGIRLLVRLPVHPAALRLLVLHALYRGPERRRTRRVGIGAPVRVRSGLRRRSAVLVDLSLGGCRLVMTDPLPEGRRLSLALPAELAGGRPLSLCGVAGRVGETDPRMPGVHTVVVYLEGLSDRDQRRLAEVVEAHSGSPAVCPADAAVPLTDPAAWAVGSVGAVPLAAEPAPAEPAPEPAPPEERRESPRVAFADPVLALCGEAARVLIGRDLSAGGMRVEPHPELRLGAELQLALHLGVRRNPFIVGARVDRNDGAEGFVLVFEDLEPAARAELERMLFLLPVVEMPETGEETRGLVVSEILRPDPPSPPAP